MWYVSYILEDKAHHELSTKQIYMITVSTLNNCKTCKARVGSYDQNSTRMKVNP